MQLSSLRNTKQIYYTVICISLAIFCLVMSQFLSLPYYWDELSVYSQAILYQYDHSLSLLPGSIPTDYSRGHPLLLTFLYAAAFRLFGPHLWVGHLLSLLISVAVAITLYVIAQRHLTKNAGIFAILLLLVQPLFLAQSTLMLPEMLLSLWVLLSIKAIIERKHLQYFIFASLAILTKESGIILPPAAIAFSLLYHLFYLKRPLVAWKDWLIYLTPLFSFGIFLCLQRLQNGWFLFPYHTGFISFKWTDIQAKLFDYTNFIFWAQGRMAITILFLLAILQWLYFRFSGMETMKRMNIAPG